MSFRRLKPMPGCTEQCPGHSDLNHIVSQKNSINAVIYRKNFSCLNFLIIFIFKNSQKMIVID